MYLVTTLNHNYFFYMSTKRLCLALDLIDDPTLISAYEYYHRSDVIGPEILAGNKAVGILSMDIYRTGNRLFMIMETIADFDLQRDFTKLRTLPRQKEWSELMLTYQQPIPTAKHYEHWVEMKQLFSHN
jgi:L-rhamnose mutarotase